jgi:hypothetical protein
MRGLGTKREDAIAEFMLKNGVMHHAERIGAHDTAHLNLARCVCSSALVL